MNWDKKAINLQIIEKVFMKKNEGSQQTVQAKWKMLTSSTELVFALYNGMQKGGVENPMSVLGEKARGQASPQSLEKLSRAGLIEVDNGRWGLSQTVFDFLESLGGTSGEANVKTIIGNRETLERNVSYYLSSKTEDSDPARYLAAIRKSLRTILNNIKRTLSAIEFSVRDSYMGERSIMLKMNILKENLEKLEELETAVRGEPNKGIYDGLQPYIETAFSENDDRLHALGVWFKTELSRFYFRRKSKITRQLRDYLDRIENIDKPARKIDQVFRLWSSNQLETFSNVTEYLGSMRGRIQNTRGLHLSLDNDILVDDNKNIEIVVREFNLEYGGSVNVATGIKRSEIGKKPLVTATYSLLSEVRKLFKDYSKTNGSTSLAEYVLAYGDYTIEHSFREKIGIFLEVVNQFRPNFVTDDNYTVYRNGTEAYKCKNIKLRTR